jgi:histidinol-phosphate aminotransferase
LSAVDDLRPRWAQVIAERARVTAALRDYGYTVPDSGANFIWLPLGLDTAAFNTHCEDNGVIVRAFVDTAGGARVTIGAPEENDAFLAAAKTYPVRSSIA